MTKVSIQKIRRFLNRKFGQEPFEEEINMTWGEKHWKAFQFSYILAGQPTPDFNLLFAWECNKGVEKKYSNEVEEAREGGRNQGNPLAFIHWPIPSYETSPVAKITIPNQSDQQVLLGFLYVKWKNTTGGKGSFYIQGLQYSAQVCSHPVWDFKLRQELFSLPSPTTTW